MFVGFIVGGIVGLVVVGAGEGGTTGAGVGVFVGRIVGLVVVGAGEGGAAGAGLGSQAVGLLSLNAHIWP